MQMRRSATRMKSAAVRAIPVEIEAASPAERTLGIGPGRHSLDRVSDALDAVADEGESRIDPGGFIHERGGATGAAMVERSVEMATAAADPSPAADAERFIQAQVFDVSNPTEPIRRRYQMRGGANHRIQVRIGLPDEEWISSPAAEAFPVAALPQDQDEWELTVVMSVAQAGDDPQVSQLLMPRAGNSSEAEFYLFVKDEWKSVEARIIVLHRNRVIQTAMLEAHVGGRVDKSDSGQRISVEPEVVAKTRFDNLNARSRFDAAFVLNKSRKGEHRLVGISDDKVAKITVGQTMSDEIANIDSILADIVDKPKAFMGKLTSKDVVGLLIRLARHGNELYNRIVNDSDLARLNVASDGPLQLISAVPDARLPIELVYSRRAPKTTARMCPGAARNLRAGKCAKACSGKENESDFICPFAFWGVQRVIERHAHKPAVAALAAGASFAVVSEPTGLRDSLDLFKGGLIAGSQRVDKTVAGGLEEICDMVGKLTGSSLKPVPTWKEWIDKVRTTGPSLMMMIVHTEETPDDDSIPQMEIGKGSWLPAVEIEEEHVVQQDGKPPLVLLLGCETGVPDRQFSNFVSRLRDKKAAIVVATGSKIHSIHAIPVAKSFVSHIREIAAKKDGATFGEIMLAVRREMLADGIPMVLALNAFGDADWRLAKHS
jgi:hypothetical protein